MAIAPAREVNVTQILASHLDNARGLCRFRAPRVSPGFRPGSPAHKTRLHELAVETQSSRLVSGQRLQIPWVGCRILTVHQIVHGLFCREEVPVFDFAEIFYRSESFCPDEEGVDGAVGPPADGPEAESAALDLDKWEPRVGCVESAPIVTPLP